MATVSRVIWKCPAPLAWVLAAFSTHSRVPTALPALLLPCPVGFVPVRCFVRITHPSSLPAAAHRRSRSVTFPMFKLLSALFTKTQKSRLFSKTTPVGSTTLLRVSGVHSDPSTAIPLPASLAAPPRASPPLPFLEGAEQVQWGLASGLVGQDGSTHRPSAAEGSVISPHLTLSTVQRLGLQFEVVTCLGSSRNGFR